MVAGGGRSFSLLGGQIKVGQIYFTPGGNWIFLLLCPKCFYSPSLLGNRITFILTLYMIFLIPPSFVSLLPPFYFRLTVVPNYLRIHLITISWDLPNSNEGRIHFQYPLGVCLDYFSYRDVYFHTCLLCRSLPIIQILDTLVSPGPHYSYPLTHLLRIFTLWSQIGGLNVMTYLLP